MIITKTPLPVRTAIHEYNMIVAPRLEPSSIGVALLAIAIVGEAISFFTSAFGFRIDWTAVCDSAGVMGGIFSTAVGARALYTAELDHRAAQTDEHNENYIKALAKFAGAVAALVSAIFFTLVKMAQTGWISLSGTAVTAYFAMSTALAGVGLVVAAGLATWGIYRCQEFTAQLELCETPQEKVQFLLNAVTDSNPRKAREKIELARVRTSLKAVQMILDRAPALLQNFDETKASALINDVQAESTKKQLVYAVGLLSAIIAFLGIVLGCFASAGILPFILMAGSSVINVGLGMSNYSLTSLQFAGNKHLTAQFN